MAPLKFKKLGFLMRRSPSAVIVAAQGDAARERT